jgi:cation transport regulator ChaB
MFKLAASRGSSRGLYWAVTSPIDGITGLRLVDIGSLVEAAAATPLVVVTQIKSICRRLYPAAAARAGDFPVGVQQRLGLLRRGRNPAFRVAWAAVKKRYRKEGNDWVEKTRWRSFGG